MQIILRKIGLGAKCKVAPLVLLLTEPQGLQNIPSLECEKNEANTAQKFMKIEGKIHDSHKLLSSALHISKNHPYIGATPDIIFICTCCEVKIVLNTNTHIQ